MEDYGSWYDTFLALAGTSPFAAMWFLFIHGGWIIVLFLVWYGFKMLWLNSKQMAYLKSRDWIYLAIDIPRMHEQTPRAVENMFAHFAGAHSPTSWVEKWFEGKLQDTISMEIVSIGGNVQFLIRTTRKLRDLIEASIYAQYPDAEITEVEDYTLRVPSHFPDREWEMFGTEMIPTKPDFYPLRTYPEFEDKVSGELKDPMAVFLESMSRIGPDEQIWFQIVLTADEQKAFRAKGEAAIKKLTGQKVLVKESMLEKAINLPLQAAGMVLETAFSSGTTEPSKKKDENPLFTRMLQMTPGERKVVEAIENKISKIVFLAKIRFLYVAKKESYNKGRVAMPFVGAIKQFNTNDMQSLKPETKKVGMNSTLWFFKANRNDARKNRFMRSFRARSNWMGTPNWNMNIEELATMWHFPITMQTRASQLKKTEYKRAEPPMNLPYGFT